MNGMLHWRQETGVSLTASSELPAIQRTPEGIAMGTMPQGGWVAMFDPAFADDSALIVRNRAKKDTFSVATALPLDQFDNDEPAFYPNGGTGMRIVGTGDIDPEQFTYVAVIQPNDEGSNSQFLLGLNNLNPTTGIIPYIRLTGSPNETLEIRSNENGSVFPLRFSYEGGWAERSGPTLLMVTFSTRSGLNVYENGALVASAPEENDPLTAGYSSGDWQMLSFYRGRVGICGIINADLSWMEHENFRRKAAAFLMSKYGI